MPPDTSQPNSNNRYDIMVLGQVDMLVDASVTTPNRTIQNCFGSFQCENDVTTAWFGYEMRNGASAFDLTQGSKTCRAVTNVNFNTQLVNPKKFSELEVNSDMIFSQFLNPSDVRFVAKTAANARNNSVYVDSGTGKLTFKDSGGTSHALY